MFLLAGLGNPGAAYAGHRHNIGFMAVDAIAEHHGFSRWKDAKGGMLCEGLIGDERMLLFKPMEFMNNSGGPLGRLARFRKIPLEKLCVIHDDLDLLPGKIRIKRGGGNGGHNGLKSLDAHLGKDYLRLRIGIGHPGDKDLVHDYVLSGFTREEGRLMEKMLDAIAEHIALLTGGDEGRFMNKVAVAIREDVKG